jgi:RHS repeat-associated protein
MMRESTKRSIRLLASIAALGVAAAIVVLVLSSRRTEPVAQKASAGGPNRTIPAHGPPPSRFSLSVRPTKEEIFRSHAFSEPLIPAGGEPSLDENAALATALATYAKRASADDFSSLTEFLRKHPQSAWAASLLTNLGFEYYNTAHYSRALDAWSRAWQLTRTSAVPLVKVLADRAGGEFANLSAKLGRMSELESFFASVEDRVFQGPSAERVAVARAGLSQMTARPEVSFRCGPLALDRIRRATAPEQADRKAFDTIFQSASTQSGFSLTAIRDLSDSIGMKYQMAFRQGGAFVVPSVVHWKVGHYAAIVRRDGDRYLLQDPTFKNDVWATQAALQAEASGFFLVPPGPLSAGYRVVTDEEGDQIFGKGFIEDGCGDECLGPCEPRSGGSDPCNDPCGSPTGPGPGPGSGPGPAGGGPEPAGMTTASVHLNMVSLHLQDHPLRYGPPVGPGVRFSVYYNQRDAAQPGIFTYSNLGPRWTAYWTSYILDNPLTPQADVKYFAMGGGTDNFSNFDAATQSFAPQKYQQSKLKRTSLNSYELTLNDGSKLLFDQPNYAIGTLRKVFLSKVVDASGNGLSFTYDEHLRLVALTDAIGQVTVLAYEEPNDPYKITKVTDPFGRFATFDYDSQGRLMRITDVIGIASEFTYDGISDFVTQLETPYGITSFTKGESGTTKWIETSFPDGNAERVEFNQTVDVFDGSDADGSDPPETVPTGTGTVNDYLEYRNTYYWSKLALAEGRGDYRKAKIYHWLHVSDYVTASGILESVKSPLEGRVWYYYGQPDPLVEGATNKPTHIGRVLDDGTTQLHKYEYNAFGKVTKTIDPDGRTFSYVYANNGIDLVEVRQTRGTNNELLGSMRYDDAHRPLEVTDAAGQKTMFTYNGRGQLLTMIDPRGGVTKNHYDTDGYLTSVDGPLPGANDTFVMTYDSLGRVDTTTDESGHTLSFDYDAFDRLTETTYPDSTYEERTYTLLDLTQLRDRAGRLTTFEYDAARQRTKTTDPLGRELQFEPCACGSTRSLTDAMGRTTRWSYDIQGRTTKKTYADGTGTSFTYEPRSGRLRERIDAKGQKTLFEYNRDGSRRRISYPNALVATPSVAFAYDQDYPRVVQMTDGIGTSLYSYNPTGPIPRLGANRLARVDGPLPNASVTYDYDELGTVKSVGVNGDARTIERDLAGRITSETNALGEFTYTYDGASNRLETETYPNGQTVEYGYGTVQQDFDLRRITNEVNGNLLSEFTYDRDVPAGRITSWTQAANGEPTKTYTFGYDDANQLTSATLAVSGQPDEVTTYSYDAAGNRLTELIDGVGSSYSYNALNELMSIEGATPPEATYEWDAQDRLIGVTSGTTAVSLRYDGLSRLSSVLVAANGSPVEDKRYVWNGEEIAVETDPYGFEMKRFLPQGMSIEQGLQQGAYYYTRDHLGSIRELVDGVGATRARYAYSPFGRQTRVSGDLKADFGFTGLPQEEVDLTFARYRIYEAAVARWLSRDPIQESGGLNLYAYANADPVNLVDRDGRMAGAAAAAAIVVGGGIVVITGAMVCALSPQCQKDLESIRRKLIDVCAPDDTFDDPGNDNGKDVCTLAGHNKQNCVYECPDGEVIETPHQHVIPGPLPRNDNLCASEIYRHVY